MRKHMTDLCIGILFFIGAVAGASAQAPPANSTARVADPPAKKTAAAGLTPAAEELLALVPPSDLLATFDLQRTVNELLPRMETLDIGGLSSMIGELKKVGIDLAGVQSTVMGFKLQSFQAAGVILAQGLDLDRPRIELLLKGAKQEFKVSEHQGIPLFTIVTPVKPPTLGPLSIKTEELTIAPLGKQRLAVGDLATIKSVVELQSGQVKNGVATPLLDALRETKPTGLLRFAFSLPEGMREEAKNQGDLFQSIAAVKVMLGDINLTNELNLTLDALMRTGSVAEASELEIGLKGLMNLVRALFGAGDPKGNTLGQVLDQIRIGVKANDVTVAVSLPRSFLEQQMGKKPETPEKK